MESFTSDAHTLVEPGPSMAVPSATESPLRIRWGRTFVALAGLLALLAAGISGALSVFSLGSATFSWIALAVFVAVVAGLRLMAIREQKLRRAARLVQRSTAEQDTAAPETAVVELKETKLFDRAVGEEAAPVQKPLTAEELRAAALRVAAKGTADAKLAHTQTLAESGVSEDEGEKWEPVEVPVPQYITAARALSLEKELTLPVAPKSAGISIKADQAGISAPSGREEIAAVPDIAAAADESAKDAAAQSNAAKNAVPAAERGNYALNNLDDVLQRRRA